MMKFRSKASAGWPSRWRALPRLPPAAAIAAVAAPAPPPPPERVTQPGSIGVIPAAGTPSGKAGSITYGYLSSNAPNWIFPITTAAANSVYNTFVFDWQMWRPLYYYPQGTTITVDQQLSPADPPVWSNGDKTMSITVKDWKWSNGQTLSSKDLLFTIDEIEAAVKASPANWAAYVPGFFPSTITSMSTPNASTLVVNMKSAVNPTWMEQDILSAIMLMPSSAWAKDSASGPTLDFTNPANALKIFNYLTAQAKSVNTYATNPLWQTVYGPYKLTSFNATTGAFSFAPNPTYSGPHANPQSNFVGSAVHLQRRSVQRHQERFGRRRSRPAGRRAADLDAEGDRLQLLRHAGLRRLLRGLQLPGQDRRLQQHRRPAVLPAGDAAPGGPGRPDQGLPQRGRRPGLHDDLAVPADPVLSLERDDEPVPVQRVHRRERAEGERLERRPQRHRHLRARRDRRRATAGPASPPAPSWPST